MKVKRCVAELVNPIAEFQQIVRGQPKWFGYFHAFAEIEWLEGFLCRVIGVLRAVSAHHTPQVGSQLRDGQIVADIERRQSLRQFVTVRGGKHPLRKVIRKSFRQKVMASQRLKSVVKDRSIAALFQSLQKLRQRSCALVPDPCQIRHREKRERSSDRLNRIGHREFASSARISSCLGVSTRSGASIRISVRSDSKLAAQR